MEVLEMIDRYVHEVSQNLPRKSRADIELELRTNLLDQLEERAAGTEPTVEMAAELLREYGEPEEMAAGYQPERFLIGPQLFPIFKLVATIMLAVVTGVFLIGLIAASFTDGRIEVGSWIWPMIAEYIQSTVVAFGSVTLIFAVIERFVGDKVRSTEKSDWDPYGLSAVEDSSRIKRPELIAGIVWSAFLIILFNFFPQWVGMISSADGTGTFFPLLAPEFSVFVPWLTLLWALGISLNLYLLWKGRWQKSSRWMEFFIGIYGLVVTFQIVTDGPITTMEWLNMFIRFGLWIGIIVGSVEAIGQLYRLLLGRSFDLEREVKSLGKNAA